MTLPSQHSRGVPGGSYTVRHGKRRVPLPVAVIALGGVALVGWLGIRWMVGGPDETRAAPVAENTTALDAAPVTPPADRTQPIVVPPQRDDATEIALGDSEPVTTFDHAPSEPAGSSADSVTTSTEPADDPIVNDAAPIESPRAAPSSAAARAEALLQENDPIGARRVLNEALLSGALGGREGALAREMLESINDDLLFSPRVYPNEARTESYEIASGDSLERITKRQDLAVDWRLIQRVNRIGDPRRIRVGQNIKLVRGPFHAVVHKDEYRLDVFAGPPDFPEEWAYVRSFDVGLGEHDSTPTGTFVVRRDSKLINPHWRNPRTGERFHADDPDNPIGERWLGIEGVGESAIHDGLGLHGTIDPDSIGKDMSMGCVRLGNEDVALIYELLVEGISVVEIRE